MKTSTQLAIAITVSLVTAAGAISAQTPEECEIYGFCPEEYPTLYPSLDPTWEVSRYVAMDS